MQFPMLLFYLISQHPLLEEADELRTKGNFAAAEQAYRRALKDGGSTRIEEKMPAWTGLTITLVELGKAAEAELVGRETLNLCGERALCQAYSWNNLAGALAGQSKWADGEVAYREAIRIASSELGAGHREVIQMLSNLAVLLASRGESVRAIPVFKRVLAQSGSSSSQKARDHHNLGAAYLENGEFESAARHLQEAWRLARLAYPPGNSLRVTCASSLGLLEIHRNKLDQAELLLHEAANEIAQGVGGDEVLMPLQAYQALLFKKRSMFAENRGQRRVQ